MILLRKRVAELEAENERLKQHIVQYCTQQTVSNQSGKGTGIPSATAQPVVPPLPSFPTTPVPPSPNTNGLNLTPRNGGNAAVSIVPPPPQQPRRSNTATTTLISSDILSLNDVFQGEREGPDVGRRLQNLKMENMENLFDDEFDPRANESKSKEQGNAEVAAMISGPSEAHKTTVEEFEELLKKVDQRLAEMRDGFQNGNLEHGDTGDSGRDLDVDEQQHAQSPQNTSNQNKQQ